MALVLAICALFGAAFGSFGYALGSRFLKFKRLNRAILLSQSRCDNCRKNLNLAELVPIFSYLILRTKCRKCKAKIAFNCFLFEILGAIFATFCFLNLIKSHAPNVAIFMLIMLLAISALLLALSLIDAKLLAVPSGLLYVCVGLLAIFGAIWRGVCESIISGLVVVALFFIISFVLSVIKKRAVSGSADSWLIFGIAAALGEFGAIVAVYIAALLGLVFIIAFKSTKIAFIPFLSIGFCLSLLFGEVIKSAFF
ncbi:A24 family peptidase [Campylobacter sp. 19-13652]|uniref:prepilin peptidase n=1 Tax=Campylobacter sp. 19-13652 TaxID=2840180 RepID=UPI001C853F21|nr:A24 family peptidase [Campylobacter sp. 19-13652]